MFRGGRSPETVARAFPGIKLNPLSHLREGRVTLHAVRVSPASRFRGRFTLPGDKSLSHRLAILGALAEGETRIGNFSTAADCASTLRCLKELGVEVRGSGRAVDVEGLGPAGLRASSGSLDVGNSGSTIRMLAGMLAARPFRSVLTGDASIRRRPMERVAEPLRAMGAAVTTRDGAPPVTIDGGSLHGITWRLSVASAQVKTAVLLAGLQAEGTTTVSEPAQSRDHTERLLPAFGVPLERNGTTVWLRGGGRLTPLTMEVPGDVSSAAFLVVAALILPGSWIHIENVLLNPARTAFLGVLQEMGAHIETGVRQQDPEPVGWIEARTSTLRGVAVGAAKVPALIDEIPALAVAATHAEGTFSVAGASELRVKESDRIAALAEGLRAMGVRVEERPGGLAIEGGPPLRGARVRAHGDHRIAMALSIAALAARGDSHVEEAECASVSFPEFYSFIERGVAGDRGRRG
jgi:3-phosphoshikimate 1-carboxyvinyltransferase